jgi:hypothetical protein
MLANRLAIILESPEVATQFGEKNARRRRINMQIERARNDCNSSLKGIASNEFSPSYFSLFTDTSRANLFAVEQEENKYADTW